MHRPSKKTRRRSSQKENYEYEDADDFYYDHIDEYEIMMMLRMIGVIIEYPSFDGKRSTHPVPAIAKKYSVR